MDTKQTTAEKIYAFIVENVNAGRTVTLWTAYKGTTLKRKHLPQVKIVNNCLMIQCGKRWIDYTGIGRATAE